MSSPIPVPAGPFDELQQTFTLNAAGRLVVEWPATPQGDLATVWGMARLLQDLETWIYMAIGADLVNPSAGNQFFDAIEQPITADPGAYDPQVNQLLLNFKAYQANDAAAGWLALDEQLDTYEFTCTLPPDGVSLRIDLWVTARGGATGQRSLTVPV